MKFPNTEAEIIVLAEKIIAGLAENANFPSPPISSSDLRNLLDGAIALKEKQVMTQAAAKQDTDAKDAGFAALGAAMKAILRYAENTVHGDDAKLAELGWGGRAERHALQAPGQPRLLEIREQGAGWLLLDWKRSADGGTPASYKIERREFSESGTWVLAGMSIDIEIVLSNQERGKEFEYRVIAVNRVGESAASNTVMAVL
jgi:hypothetical protein